MGLIFNLLITTRYDLILEMKNTKRTKYVLKKKKKENG